jgi:hypothetical protein
MTKGKAALPWKAATERAQLHIVRPTQGFKNGIDLAAALNGTAAFPFVIPSVAEGSAVQRTSPGNPFSAGM